MLETNNPNELEELLKEKLGDEYSSDNLKLLERDVSAEALGISAEGVKSYRDALDERYGKGQWASVQLENTKPGHYDIVAYVVPNPETASPSKSEEVTEDPDDVLWSKSTGERTLTLLRGGLYEKKEK